MSSLNIRTAQPMTVNAAGTPVRKLTNANEALTRVTLAHMLWEDQFYVDGKTSANVMTDLVAKADPAYVAILAEKARSEFKLRHVPLYLTRELARTGKLKAATLTAVIQRPDEMSEFLSIYWKDGKVPISNQVKKGLAQAFVKFNEYQLAKWDKNNSAISLRDVMFLSHAKPLNATKAELFKRVANQELKTPDTWETQLSAGADKAETFSRLMVENKLGALAFLRNLRNMVNAGIAESTIRAYAKQLDVTKVLPFRYIAAARIVPQFEDMLEEMMLRSLEKHEKLPGKTVLLIDVSGSMFGTKVSAKSDLDRFDAAAALAILCREICEEVEIYSFSNSTVRVSPRRGFALIEAIRDSQSHSGTATGAAVRSINANTKYDRLVIFTDEQSHDSVPKAKGLGYVINVGSYENGINRADYTTITGFSEAVVDYIQMAEKFDK